MSRSIPKAIRQQAWLVDKLGECYKSKCTISWCENTISVFDFHCGHDIPHSKGGTLDIGNLHPICSRCNLGMSDKFTIKEWNCQFKLTKQHGFLCCFSRTGS
mgnify:CR=1 FL=1|tara:strand:- start:495 stop:800 length:306 start_codon:yes stop_codon:yes gene_type:complete